MVLPLPAECKSVGICIFFSSHISLVIYLGTKHVHDMCNISNALLVFLTSFLSQLIICVCGKAACLLIVSAILQKN